MLTMTVLGFGRANVGGKAEMLINETGKAWTFGLVDSAEYNPAAPAINGSYWPLVITQGLGQRDLGGSSALALSTMAVTPGQTDASVTFQTTTAAISIGFPSWSLTLIRLVSKLRMRIEIGRRSVNGLTHWRPCSWIVPR